jgi:hypothetical protein
VTTTGKSRNSISGKNNNTSSTNSGGNGINYKPSTNTLAEYIYYIGSAKQAADYQTTTDFIINHIIKTLDLGNDIATALSDDEGKCYDVDKHKPKLWQVNLSIDTVEDDFEAELESKQYRMEFKADYDAYTKNENNAMKQIQQKHMH